MKRAKPDDVSIGKFDILAAYTYAKARHDGHPDDEAKERAMVAAIMGAKARSGGRRPTADDFAARKDAAEKKKDTTITPASFDHQVKTKLGAFFDAVFLPAMEEFVEAGLSYDDVKRVVGIPATWGAKILGQQFEARWKEESKARRGRASPRPRPSRKKPAR